MVSLLSVPRCNEEEEEDHRPLNPLLLFQPPLGLHRVFKGVAATSYSSHQSYRRRCFCVIRFKHPNHATARLQPLLLHSTSALQQKVRHLLLLTKSLSLAHVLRVIRHLWRYLVHPVDWLARKIAASCRPIPPQVFHPTKHFLRPPMVALLIHQILIQIRQSVATSLLIPPPMVRRRRSAACTACPRTRLAAPQPLPCLAPYLLIASFILLAQ